ncbi:hypothetical protein LQ327_27865 [Actinomycetospora endophytica]|uniref:Uncharacterized protein n=1 Tax=Actinomycetospora endophytica TaxID=2291215 RepID=A0ABS8PG91_9PSEU|nr:hypothetical protein [Actinomycetospora endophytica]MCD2197194.1 hypothetical protein [Actinomycetospora endophytica]
MSTPSPSRRSVLRATAGLVLTGTALTAAAACGNADQGPDELEAPLAAARADAALATVAGQVFPDLTARVTPVAQARRAHADALAAEVRRARPDRADAVDAPVTPPRPPASSAAAASALRTSLVAARDAGSDLAVRTARYRSGLMASVAAACAGYAEVLG